jgi:hypothetical protein
MSILVALLKAAHRLPPDPKDSDEVFGGYFDLEVIAVFVPTIQKIARYFQIDDVAEPEKVAILQMIFDHVSTDYYKYLELIFQQLISEASTAKWVLNNLKEKSLLSSNTSFLVFQCEKIIAK